LRIELGRERDHLVARHQPRSVLEHASRSEVFEMEPRQAADFQWRTRSLKA
jgi:hypothetical protein